MLFLLFKNILKDALFTFFVEKCYFDISLSYKIIIFYLFGKMLFCKDAFRKNLILKNALFTFVVGEHATLKNIY